MPLQILPLLISPWPKHPQKLEKMEVECRSLNIASLQSNIKWSLKLCRYLSTHLCRDESLMKNLIVITLNLSGKKEKVSHNTFISVFIFFTLGGGFGGFFLCLGFFIIVIVWFFSCRKMFDYLNINWMKLDEEVVMTVRHGDINTCKYL